MNKTLPFDIKKLQSALIITLCAVLLSTYAYYRASEFLQKEQQYEANIRQEIQMIEERRYDATEQQRVYDTMLGRYNQLSQTGAFKADTRLEWIESIQEASLKKRIPSTTYTLEKRHRHSLPATFQANRLGFYKTIIKLDMMMLHEGDLLSAYDYFADKQLGIFHFEQCSLNRVAAKANLDNLEPLVSASCDIGMFNYIFDDDNSPDELIAMELPL